MPAERDLNRCDFVSGFNDTDNTPHQEAIEALVFELSEAHQERREEDPEWWSRSDAQIQSLSDSIDLLCELRDGAARVIRPADNAPEPHALMEDPMPASYCGPFQPLPDAIRERCPTMLAWEFDKTYPTLGTWRPKGWNVILPDGILTFDLHGDCVRDRILYA